MDDAKGPEYPPIAITFTPKLEAVQPTAKSFCDFGAHRCIHSLIWQADIW